MLSIFGAVWFTDPDILLPLVRERMILGGVLAFSHLPPGSQGPRPGDAGMRHDHSPDEWARFLPGHGFSEVGVSLVGPPPGRAVGTTLGRARAA
ncbi:MULTISPECIES: hypothetical protein [Actinoalloteichus]|uniref:hypothetical protein n=1 Tax=Actinoalloteichus TaxID=65496 RepID=UPI001B7FD22C|nr:hypothetical protein [Actinoalloteichus caeruleus]